MSAAPAAPKTRCPGKQLGLLEAVAYNQVECFEAGVMFARAEGIVPAPEANHAGGRLPRHLGIDRHLTCREVVLVGDGPPL